ncbi:MAG: hypothetical protein OEU92_22270 [Alphaproteobacteria bacterium]|nr:hypothetical protein [Alphaproteobacteria bacterium]
MSRLDIWIKDTPDGRVFVPHDYQEAWAGAYEGKYEVERMENMHSGDPGLEVLDKDATEDQLAFREGRDDDREER